MVQSSQVLDDCYAFEPQASTRCRPRRRHRRRERVSVRDREDPLARPAVKPGYAPRRLLSLLVCASIICSVAFGLSPHLFGVQQRRKTPPVQISWNPHPHTRIKTLPIRASSRLGASSGQPNKASSATSSVDTERKNYPDPPIVEEVNEIIALLIECLHDEGDDPDGDVSLSSRPIELLRNVMSLYSNWVLTDNPTTQLKFKASAAVDRAFRLVTSEAFSAPYQLSWVNLGMEALQLQLHSDEFDANLNINGSINRSAAGISAVNGNGSDVKLIPLVRPYDAIPKGTWLKALRALTSKDVGTSRSSPARSVKMLSPKDGAQWTAPPDAAFRILQRLVNGRGVRVFRKKKLLQQQNAQQQSLPSLDERDFNMVLHAYARAPGDPRMDKLHAVMALQERNAPRAPPLSPVAYSILLRAYGRTKDAENVEMSLTHARRNGVVPDIVMVNTVLDAYVECGMLDKAREVGRSVGVGDNDGGGRGGGKGGDAADDDAGFWPLLKPNSRTYNTLLKGMAEDGDLQGAMKLSRAMRSDRLWDDITTNTLVKAAVTASEFRAAESILSNHTSSRSPRGGADHPNVEAYTELLDGYAKNGQLENAMRVMQLMQDRGVRPNEYTYTCAVGALARENKVRQARKMIEYALRSLDCGGRRRMALRPTYNAFISGVLSDGGGVGQASSSANIVEALAVLQEMEDRNIAPNVVTVALVVDGMGRCSPPRCKEARELVQHLEYTSKIKKRSKDRYYINRDSDEGGTGGAISLSNNKIATALIQAFGRANDVESAMDSFNLILNPDVIAFNALLDVCARSDQLKLALEMFDKRASFKCWQEWEGVINSSGRMVRGDKEQERPIKPDVVTFTTLISAILQLNTRAATRRAIKMYDEMKRKWWISPDTILVDTIIRAMISEGPVGFDETDVKFTLTVLRDGARLEWEDGQYETRKKAVRGVLMGCSSEVYRYDEFAFDLVNERQPEDLLFTKKGWNTIDSGFRLWNSGRSNSADANPRQGEGDESSVDSFLASKGWNDIDSGFRLL